MKLVTCIYGLATYYALISGSACMKDANEDDDDFRERRDDIIQEVGRSLLGVKEVSESDGSPRRTPPPPPRYMLDLYDRYKSGQTLVQGNTVRSILPMRGKLKGVDMLVFNLTGIHAEEQILQGKLHIFRRRQSRRNSGGGGRKREAVRLKIVDLSLKSPPHWVEVPKQKNSGWQSFDITESVILCRNAQHDGDYLLGVSSESRRPNGKYKPIPIRRIARLSSQPFLIIFSEDRNNRTVNSTADQEIVPPSYEEIREMLLNHHNLTQDHRSTDGSAVLRKKRSVRSEAFLNYLLYDTNISNYHSGSEFVKNGSTRNHSTYETKDISHKVYTSAVPNTQNQSETQAPKKTARKINRRTKQKRKNNRAKSSYMECQRKDLIVDFSVFGWDDWILSPLSFNAYYCTGSCAFPFSRRHSSNHAVIQSLWYEYTDPRLRSGKVSRPCCVPSSTKSLEILYINDRGKRRLKKLQEMIVESCACT